MRRHSGIRLFYGMFNCLLVFVFIDFNLLAARVKGFIFGLQGRVFKFHFGSLFTHRILLSSQQSFKSNFDEFLPSQVPSQIKSLRQRQVSNFGSLNKRHGPTCKNPKIRWPGSWVSSTRYFLTCFRIYNRLTYVKNRSNIVQVKNWTYAWIAKQINNDIHSESETSYLC